MATSYGLKCVQCNKGIVPTNMREDAAKTVLQNVSKLMAFRNAYMALPFSVWFQHDLYAECGLDLKDLLNFFAEHDGHEFQVIDEYQYYDTIIEPVEEE